MKFEGVMDESDECVICAFNFEKKGCSHFLAFFSEKVDSTLACCNWVHEAYCDDKGTLHVWQPMPDAFRCRNCHTVIPNLWNPSDNHKK